MLILALASYLHPLRRSTKRRAAGHAPRSKARRAVPGAPARIQNVLSYAALSCAADAASISSMLTP